MREVAGGLRAVVPAAVYEHLVCHRLTVDARWTLPGGPRTG